MAEFEEVLKLKDFLKTPARKLSLGQKMRCELAASLIHNPKIVFLDEPTIGLDVAAKQSIREFVKRINRERGVTVILTTHDLRDIEELCSRVFIIDKGHQVFDGTLDRLKHEIGSIACHHHLRNSSANCPKAIGSPTACRRRGSCGSRRARN